MRRLVLFTLLSPMFGTVASAAWDEIDNFDSRDLGPIDGQGDWFGTDIYDVVIDHTDSQNQVLQILPVGTAENAYYELTDYLEDGTTGTLFFRFWPAEDLSHMNFGLSDVERPGGNRWNDFEAQIRDNQGGGLDFRDNGGFTNVLDTLELEEWYNVWMVIDNNQDILEGYIQSEISFPTQTQLTAGAQDTFDFRFGTDDPLVAFYLRAGNDHEGDWYLDDVYLDLSGENLSFPSGVPVQLWAGDADEDLDFDQLDLVRVQTAAKYLTGLPANWSEGDWDGAPGGSPGNPPGGNGLFDQLDIIAALAPGHYLTGPYAAIGPARRYPDGVVDGQTSILYNYETGEISVDAPAGTNLTSVKIDSATGIFTRHEDAQNLDGSFDTHAEDNVFKATFGNSFGSISFGLIAEPGLSREFVAEDLTVVGSLEGGGGLGPVDLIYAPAPEPSTWALLILGLFSAAWCRRQWVSN